MFYFFFFFFSNINDKKERKKSYNQIKGTSHYEGKFQPKQNEKVDNIFFFFENLEIF